MKSKKYVILVLLMSMLVVSTLVAVDTKAALASSKVLKIGCTLPLQIREALEIQKWLKLFAKLINEKGGWNIGGETYSIQWIIYNDEYRAEKARAAVERLIHKDKVKHIINQWGGAPLIATIKVTDPNKILVIGTSVSDEPVKPVYNYVFKGTDPIPFQAGVTAANLREHVKNGVKTMVVVYPDDATGRALKEQNDKCIPRIGGLKVLDSLFYRRGTVDFSPIATKAKSLNPDLIWYATITGEDITKLTSALYNTGYKGKFCIDNLHAGVMKDIVDKTGPDYLEGTISFTSDVKQYQKDPEMVQYIKAYEKEYGGWSEEGAFWVANWFVFKGAVEATQSLDVEVIAKYLSNSPRPVKTLAGWQTSIARPDLGNLRTVASVNSLTRGIVKNGKVVPYTALSSTEMYRSFVQVYGMEEVYEKYWREHKYPKFPD